MKAKPGDVKIRARLDRILSVRLFAPFCRWAFPEDRKKIPVLMYHSVSNDKERVSHPYFAVNTTPGVFSRQMQYLSDSGYRAVHLDAALDLIRSGSGTGEKVVVLTFDDGYMDFYEEAVKTLRRVGFAATVYLPSSLIGDRFSRSFNEKACLTWDRVRELSLAGHAFGSHSATHRLLRELGREELEEEIRRSKQVIEDKIGKPVDSFSHPYAFPEEDGAYMRRLRDLLAEAGYRHGVSTNIGRISREDDRYFLRRIPVNSFDDRELFHAKLIGGYDWLFAAQKAYKYLKMGRPRRGSAGRDPSGTGCACP